MSAAILKTSFSYNTMRPCWLSQLSPTPARNFSHQQKPSSSGKLLNSFYRPVITTSSRYFKPKQTSSVIHRPAIRLLSNASGSSIQEFQITEPKSANLHNSSIDFFFLPCSTGYSRPISNLRVPLLPDNFTPTRSADIGHPFETSDDAFTRSKLIVVASHPMNVLHASKCDVICNDSSDAQTNQIAGIL
ncbi:unnamed protein product [Blumeria hordei]|uniref:Uncharacterized protein n=1 Tax=Blumeria hordei TaxID=2867405 RepID=A0A383V2V8_BLUHO|nr:unnamed protein product [Blumeria hordei]